MAQTVQPTFKTHPIRQQRRAFYANYADPENRMHFGMAVKYEFLRFAEDLRKQGYINQETTNSSVNQAFADYLGFDLTKLLQWARGESVPSNEELRQFFARCGYKEHQVEFLVAITSKQRFKPDFVSKPIDDPILEQPAGLPYYIITAELEKELKRAKQKRQKEAQANEGATQASGQEAATDSSSLSARTNRRRASRARALAAAYSTLSADQKRGFIKTVKRHGVDSNDISKMLTNSGQPPANFALDQIEKQLLTGGELQPEVLKELQANLAFLRDS